MNEGVEINSKYFERPIYSGTKVIGAAKWRKESKPFWDSFGHNSTFKFYLKKCHKAARTFLYKNAKEHTLVDLLDCCLGEMLHQFEPILHQNNTTIFTTEKWVKRVVADTYAQFFHNQ